MTTPPNQDAAHGDTKRSSAECKSLLAAATPELFRQNAFRVTGLHVDATAREVNKHVDKLKLLQELGDAGGAQSAAFKLDPPPSSDQIREALQRLKDPELRIIDELFWFWPEEMGRGQADPALQALLAGDQNTALRIWAGRETDPKHGVVAMHNIALAFNIRALDWEYQGSANCEKEKNSKIEEYWREAFKRWNILTDDELLWETVTRRIKEIDDPRLTTGFVRRLRGTLTQALLKINVELALRYSTNGKTELAQMHVNLVQEAFQNPEAFRLTTKSVLAPTLARFRDQVKRARQSADIAPEKGHEAALSLMKQAHHLLSIFKVFSVEKDDTDREVIEEAVAACLTCLVAYQRKTSDNQTFVGLLECALPLSENPDLRERIIRNITIGNQNQADEALEPLFRILQAIQESDIQPSWKLGRVKSEILPKIEEIKKKHGAGSSTAIELSNKVAIVLRGIAIDAHNDHNDFATASAAIDSALTLASEEQLKTKLRQDAKAINRTISQNKTSPATTPVESNKGGIGCLVISGILIAIALASSCNSSKRSASTGYTTPHQNTYQAPSSGASGLKTESVAIERDRISLESLSAELDRMARDIESERTYLNRNSEYAVDRFNNKIQQYNLKLQHYELQQTSFNQRVANYNAKLRRSTR